MKNDKDLPVLRSPVMVTDENVDWYTRLSCGGGQYKLPVVHVSKTADGEDPLDTTWLSSRLKGAVHILVETASVDHLKIAFQENMT